MVTEVDTYCVAVFIGCWSSSPFILRTDVKIDREVRRLEVGILGLIVEEARAEAVVGQRARVILAESFGEGCSLLVGPNPYLPVVLGLRW